MKIILSPAKKMHEDTDALPFEDLPVYLSRTRAILDYLRSLSAEQLQTLWKCNDSIARQNIQRLETMNLKTNLSPAVFAYDGIAFQHMAPTDFEEKQLEYIQEHLRILSAFYGVLKPMDGVRPYRLEMQAAAKIADCADLYDFWGEDLYRQVRDPDGIIINLASEEYSRCIEKYLGPEDRMITCIFAENVNGRMIQKATFAKMARGEMVRFMSENEIENPEEMKRFNRMDFCFRPELSAEQKYIFERKAKGQ